MNSACFLPSGDRRWSIEGETGFAGCLIVGGSCLSGFEAAALVDKLASFKEALSLLRRSDGFFAIVTRRWGCWHIVTDPVRSIPLFYCRHNGRWLISDDAAVLVEVVGAEDASIENRVEFALTGYCTDSETLKRDVKQVPAGTVLVLDDSSEVPATVKHCTFGSDDHCLDSDPLILEGLLNNVVEASINDLCEYAGGAQIVVPLSGGYDSRLILAKLVAKGYPNLLAYTYGARVSREVEVSRGVAATLGVRWEYIKLTDDLWQSWYRSIGRREYFRRSHAFATVPHIQDVVVVDELKRQGIVEGNAVFAPGHSGDFLAGSHIPSNLVGLDVRELDSAVDAVWNRHYQLWDSSRFAGSVVREVKTRLRNQLAECLPPEASPLARFENWDWAERQAKFIVNSARVYEYHGYRWWMPLWSRQMIEFWNNVPLEMRLGKVLYDSYVRRCYSDVGEVDERRSARREVSTMRSVLRTGLGTLGVLGALRSIRATVRQVTLSRRSEHGWLSTVDPDAFACLYSGRETINSFLVWEFVDIEDLLTDSDLPSRVMISE